MLETTLSVSGAQITRNQDWAAGSAVCPTCPHAGSVSGTSPSANASEHVVTAVTALSASVMAHHLSRFILNVAADLSDGLSEPPVTPPTDFWQECASQPSSDASTVN